MKTILHLSLGLFVAGLCLAGGAAARAQTQLPVARHLELVSYGADAGEVRIVVGRSIATAQVRMIPTGGKIEVGPGPKLEVRQKIKTPEGKDDWALAGEADLPPAVADFFAVLVPLAAPDVTGLRYRIVVMGLQSHPLPGQYTLANITPVPVVVQVGQDQDPVEMAAWSQHDFLPKTDKKYRALMRVAYRTPAGGWEVLRSGVVSLPPDQAVFGKIILAAKGMEELGAGSAVAATQPTVLILEATRMASPPQVVALADNRR